MLDRDYPSLTLPKGVSRSDRYTDHDEEGSGGGVGSHMEREGADSDLGFVPDSDRAAPLSMLTVSSCSNCAYTYRFGLDKRQRSFVVMHPRYCLFFENVSVARFSRWLTGWPAGWR